MECRFLGFRTVEYIQDAGLEWLRLFNALWAENITSNTITAPLSSLIDIELIFEQTEGY